MQTHPCAGVVAVVAAVVEERQDRRRNTQVVDEGEVDVTGKARKRGTR